MSRPGVEHGQQYVVAVAISNDARQPTARPRFAIDGDLPHRADGLDT